jgi:EAL domain-containing protein (putative c-di-GMP-specific phosphodiesterase class I)
VRLPAGRVEGVEALLRWSHPRRGQVPPAAFIPVAEDTGLIVPIGAWVLNEACRQLAEWRQKMPGMEDLHISVNLSARQLRDESLVDTVKRTLATYRLPASSLHLELTESHLMENPANAADLLAKLRDVGVRLSIDDFGTGYSSLSYLQRFAVDAVKIDRSFVMRLEDEDTSDESLVAAIVAMAGALQVTTVAEGVETEAQAQRLFALGCHVAQGYLYSRPVPAEQLPVVFEQLGGRVTRLRPVPARGTA